MRRKTWVPAGAAVLLAVTVTGGVVLMSGAEQAKPAAQESPADTGKVERGELSSMVSLNGTLTYRARPDGSPYSAINQASGIYTSLPDEGDKVRCGDVLYRVDDAPVVMLCGTVPAYRDLSIGDEGSDVRQLNRNLHKLGYDTAAGDKEFTWKTREALEDLQHDKGFDEETGELDNGDAVVLPGPGRLSKVAGELGGPARPGGPVAQLTSDTLEVQVELDASQRGDVKQGDRVQITLPGNRAAKGEVERVGRVARPVGKDDGAGAAVIPAYISLDEPKQARGLDRAPVQVDIVTEGVKSALSVPVVALVGKSGGGFAVEVVRAGGRRELVAVKLGLFDTTAGRVEVEGDLHEGDQVVVPSS